MGNFQQATSGQKFQRIHLLQALNEIHNHRRFQPPTDHKEELFYCASKIATQQLQGITQNFPTAITTQEAANGYYIKTITLRLNEQLYKHTTLNPVLIKTIMVQRFHFIFTFQSVITRKCYYVFNSIQDTFLLPRIPLILSVRMHVFYSKLQEIHYLAQGWGTSGPRSVYGPRDHLVRPSRYFINTHKKEIKILMFWDFFCLFYIVRYILQRPCIGCLGVREQSGE